MAWLVLRSSADMWQFMQLVEAGRDVVATSHTPDKLEKRLDSKTMNGEGRLHLESSIDITDSSALMQAELWKGVSQVVTTVGPAFGRQPDGSMGYAAAFMLIYLITNSLLFCSSKE